MAGSGEPRIINNVDMDYVFRKDPLTPDTRSEAVIPLIAGQEVIGVLDVHSRNLNIFGEDEIAILQILADELSIAIQNARLVQNLQQRVVEVTHCTNAIPRPFWSREALGKRVGGYEYNLLEVMPINGGEEGHYDLPVEVLDRLKKWKGYEGKEHLAGACQRASRMALGF